MEHMEHEQLEHEVKLLASPEYRRACEAQREIAETLPPLSKLLESAEPVEYPWFFGDHR